MQSFPQTRASCPRPGSGSSWATFRTSVCKDFPFRAEKPSPGLSPRLRAPLGAKPGHLSVLPEGSARTLPASDPAPALDTAGLDL